MPVGDYDVEAWDRTAEGTRALAASVRAIVRWNERTSVRLGGERAAPATSDLVCTVRVPREWTCTEVRADLQRTGPVLVEWGDSRADVDPALSEATLQAPGLRPGRYEIVLYPFLTARSLDLKPGPNHVTFDLPRPGRVRVRIPEEWVGRLRSVSWLRTDVDWWHCSGSDYLPPDGREHVVLAHPGRYSFSLFGDGAGARDREVEVRAGEEETIAIQPYRTSRLEVRLEPRSALPPDERVEVWLVPTGSSVGAASVGFGTLNGIGDGEVEPGTYRVEIEATRTSDAAVVPEVRLDAGGSRRITIPVQALK
jgi:hypothetical protein